MKKPYFIILSLIFITVAAGCKKDDIPSDKALLFEENFVGNYSWSIIGEIDSSIVEPGEAAGEINNDKLYLHASGCTEVNASLSFTSAELTDEAYKNMTITVDIDEFTASPLISSSNTIDISFKNFYLSIKPKQDISDLLLVFNLNKNAMELVDQTDAIEYTYSASSSYDGCNINLKSQSSADCIANAHLKVSSIKIYKK